MLEQDLLKSLGLLDSTRGEERGKNRGESVWQNKQEEMIKMGVQDVDVGVLF